MHIYRVLTLALVLEIKINWEGLDRCVGDGRRRMADNSGSLLHGRGGGDHRGCRRWARTHGGDTVTVSDGRGDRRRGRNGIHDGRGGRRRRGRRWTLLVAFLRLFLDLDLMEDCRRRHSALHFHARKPRSHLRVTR